MSSAGLNDRHITDANTDPNQSETSPHRRTSGDTASRLGLVVLAAVEAA